CSQDEIGEWQPSFDLDLSLYAPHTQPLLAHNYSRVSAGARRPVAPWADGAPVPPADFEEGVGDLAEAARTDRVHEDREEVLPGQRRQAQPVEHRRPLVGVASLEVAQAPELTLLLVLARSGQLHLGRRGVPL